MKFQNNQQVIQMVIVLNQLKEKIKAHIKLVLSIASIFFWIIAHHVCNYFYPDGGQLWWWLKADFYVLIISICYVLMTLKSSTFKRVKFTEDFMIQFGVIFASSNVFDRWVLGSRIFSWHAYYPLLLIAIVSYFNLKRLNKIAEKAIKNHTE